MTVHHDAGLLKCGSPRALRASRSTQAVALVVVLVGAASLWNFTQQSSGHRGKPFVARGVHLQRLGAPPPLQLDELPLSSHQCTTTDNPNHRVCQFSNLVLHGGTVYYLTDDTELELPQVDTTYHPSPDEKFAPTVLPRSNAAFLLPDQNTKEWAAVPLAWLWRVTKRWDNLAHHFGEDAVTLHNTLCTHLGECAYPPRRQVQLVMLDSKHHGALLAPVNATLARCVTGWPGVYRDDDRFMARWPEDYKTKTHSRPMQTVVLEEAWAGIGPTCHAQRGCSGNTEYGQHRGDKRGAMAPAALQSWRLRLGACYGFNVVTPAPLRGKNIVIVDRPYEAGRHMLNVRSVEQFVRQRFPQDSVRVQYFEDVAFPDQLRIVSSISLLIMVHGSAIALWPFLPPGAVAVHIAPDLETANKLQHTWADHYAQDWGFTGLTYVPLNNSDASRQHMRWERLLAQDAYQSLTPEAKLGLLERGECPEALDDLCTFHWKRQELSLVLDLDHLAWALDTAEAQLLRREARQAAPAQALPLAQQQQ